MIILSKNPENWKVYYRLRKAELDLDILCTCDDNNVVPDFLDFRVANNDLKHSSNYIQS